MLKIEAIKTFIMRTLKQVANQSKGMELRQDEKGILELFSESDVAKYKREFELIFALARTVEKHPVLMTLAQALMERINNQLNSKNEN